MAVTVDEYVDEEYSLVYSLAEFDVDDSVNVISVLSNVPYVLEVNSDVVGTTELVEY